MVVPFLTGCAPKDDANTVASAPTGTGNTPKTESKPEEKPPVSAAEAGDPIAGAKGAIAEMSKVKSLSDFADHLTNESAAAVTVPMVLIFSLVAGMGDAFSSMGDSLAKMGGQPNAQQSEKAKQDQAKMKKMSEDMKAFTKKYGLDTISPGAKPDAAKIADLSKNGRAMMKEMGGLLDAMGDKAGAEMSKPKDIPTVEDLEYKVISPTEVKITPKNPKNKKGLTDSASMKFEDGAWRLHIGSFTEIMNDMQKQNGKMGMPPGAGMGGAMPGGNSAPPPTSTQ